VVVAAGDDKKSETAGISSTTLDVAVVFERLKQDVREGVRTRLAGPPPTPPGSERPPSPAGDIAERNREIPGRLSSFRLRVLSGLRGASAAPLRCLPAERGRTPRRFQVAYYSPLPPERSGVAGYSALLLPALRARLDVGVARRRRRPPAADVALYHVGNNPEIHGWVVEALRRRPGVVVLHELVLHHLVVGMTLGRGDTDGYLRALERDAGPAGRRLGLDVIEGRFPPLWEIQPERFPLVGEVLDLATALVVHSRFVEERVRAAGFTGPIRRIAHPAPPPQRVDPVRIDGGPVIGSFGFVNAAKRVPQLLTAFAELRRSHADARLLLIGPTVPGFDLQAELSHVGLDRSEGVVRDEWVPEERFSSLMAACDVCVNLRAPTMGETSGSAVRSLALGRPLVTSDVGWFAELPDDVTLKVPVDEFEVATLTGALELLSGDDAARRTLGEHAAAYARREHDLERVADEYSALLVPEPIAAHSREPRIAP
jgi:glycosyltransferase involved in cell wall biosynthesis